MLPAVRAVISNPSRMATPLLISVPSVRVNRAIVAACREEGMADMGNLIKVLGASMYAANVADVAVKELLQNAFDAVKGAVKVGLIKTGDIKITLDAENRTITVSDNARGMTPDIIKSAFFTVGGTSKTDLDPGERSGGLGLAKMGFMLGSEWLKLDTVRDGMRTTVDATAEEIAGEVFQIKKHAAPKSEHGTTVTVKIPENYTDPKTGQQKTIFFPWAEVSFARDLPKDIALPPPIKARMRSPILVCRIAAACSSSPSRPTIAAFPKLSTSFPSSTRRASRVS